MRRILVTLLVSVLASSSLAGSAMTENELNALLASGRTLTLGGAKEGYKGHLKLTTDGKGSGQVTLKNGKIITFEGTWKIKGKKFCRVWAGGPDAGKQVCETWVKTGKKSVRVMVGKKDLGVNSWD